MANRQTKNLIYILLIPFLLTAFFVLLAVFFEPLLPIFSGPIRDGDSEWYIAAAQGEFSKLIEPYSVRFLHPFIARGLSYFSALNINQAFLVLAIASLFLFFVVNAFILKKNVKYPLLIIPIFSLPYFLDMLTIIFHPDIFYIFLTSVFFLLLLFKKESMSLITLFLLFLARESTVLLGAIYSFISWLFSKKLLAVAIIAIILVSFSIADLMRDIGEPNIHKLNSSVYLVAKLSFNFLTNVLGVKPWANTYTNCNPVFKLNLPDIKSFGNIHEVGFCGFEIIRPIQTLIILLTVFGIAPLFLFYIFLKKGKRFFAVKAMPFWLLIALVYGLANYFIGIIAGTGIQRIVGYGWPVFLLVTPILMHKFFNIDKKFITKFSLIHLFVAWFPFVLRRLNGDELISSIFILFVVLGVYVYTFRLIKRQELKEVALLASSW